MTSYKIIIIALIYSKHFELQMCKFSKKFIKYFVEKYQAWLIPHPAIFNIKKACSKQGYIYIYIYIYIKVNY